MRRKSLATATLVVLLGVRGSAFAATPLDTNLLVNGDAEALPGATTATDVVAPTGWTTTSNFTAMSYSVGDNATSLPSSRFPNTATSVSYSGGRNFFSGGANTLDSSASQKIDISDRAREIDLSLLSARLSGILGAAAEGGNYPVNGSMTLTVNFLDAIGKAIGQQSISGSGAMTLQAGFAPVPSGTRSLLVTLRATCSPDPYGGSPKYDYATADTINVQLVVTGGVNTWAQSFSGQNYDLPRAVAPLPDGGVVVYGMLFVPGTSTTNLKYTDALVRYGADGKILWTKEFTDTQSIYNRMAGRLATDKQGNIYFASVFNNPTNDNAGGPFVAKFNADGVQQWFTNVKVPASEAVNQQCYSGFTDREGYLNGGFSNIVVNDDGTISLGSGVYYDPCDTVTFPAIVTLNASTGAPSLLLLYTKNEIDTRSTGYVAALARSKTTGNYAMLTGDPDHTSALVLVSPSGATLAIREPYGYGGARDSAALLLGTADGGFLVVSNGSAGYSSYTTITKFASDLTVQFEKRTLSNFSSVVERPEGGYLLQTGFASQQYPKGVDCLVEFDAEGRLEKAFLVGGTYGDGFYTGDDNANHPTGGAVFTADGGIAFATATKSYSPAGNTNNPSPAWWIGKMDKLGRIANFSDFDDDGGSKIATFPDNGIPSYHDGLPFTDPLSLGLEIPAQKAPQTLQSQDAPGVVAVQAVPAFPVPPPVHGGLSGTTLTVNGNTTAVRQDLAGTILHFIAEQTGRAAGFSVRVQYTSDPNNEASWTDLPNNDHGFMVYDVAHQEYALNTTNYPLQNGVYFRAFAFGGGYSPSTSNIVGPFNLADTATHLSPVTLHLAANGIIADAYFTASAANLPSGATVRVQSTTTPMVEGSWTDLGDGNSGHMTACDPAYPGQFYLLDNKLPAGSGIYFRAVASAQGAIDSLSPALGPYTVLNDTPPSVTVSVTGASGSGTLASPYTIAAGVVTIKATATTSRSIRHFSLQVNGQSKYSLDDDTTSLSYSITLLPGDYVVEGLAIDDLGVTTRGGSGAVILHVTSAPSSSVQAEGAVGASSSSAIVASKTYTVAVDGGEWTSSATWKDANGKIGTGYPGETDFAIIGASTVRITQADAIAGSVSINGGKLVGGDTSRQLYVLNQMTIFAGTIEGKVRVTIDPLATLELANPSDVQFVADASGANGELTNAGICNVHGTGGIVGAAGFHNPGTLNWHVPMGVPPRAGVDPTAAIRQIQASAIDLSGKVTGVDPGKVLNAAQLITDNGSGVISNDGSTVISNDGSTLVSHDGGSLISNDGSSLISNDGSSLISNDGSSLADKSGTPILLNGGANILLNGGANLINGYSTKLATRMNARADSAPGVVHQTGGELNLSACSVAGDVVLDGGVISGSGIIGGNLTNNSGYVMPGHSAGLLAVVGNYTQGAGGTMVIEQGGPYPRQSDQVQIGGSANLGGKLDVRTINGYQPSTSDTFNPIAYSAVTGSFATISSNSQVTVNATGIVTSVDATKPNPGTGQPLNISTRMEVLTGDNVLIGGFIVYDPTGANASKKVIIRALGPSLPASGALSDPYLILHGAPGGDISNDNWQQGDTSQIPSGFAPSDPRESVIVVTLPPGAYTAEVKGAHGETGIGLVEVYDLTSSATSKLANISTRGFVDTGDNVMIGGFIVGGQDASNPLTGEPGKVLVRGIGPSLAKQSVQGALSATTLELHDANGGVISNQGWRGNQEADINATGIPPQSDQDSAIIATLPPGAYTAILRGANNTTGVGLIEAYNLP